MKSTETTEIDIVILGGGLMGSAAAWQLSREGKKVLLLEQQEATYTNGSSFGEARICRSLGPKHDIWSYLHRRALDETQELLKFLNEVDNESHKMEDIYTTTPVTYILHTDKSEVVQRMLRQQEDKYTCVTSAEEAREKLGIKSEAGQIVIQEYRKHTGTINPRALIEKLHRAIVLKGNEVRYGCTVLGVLRDEGKFSIRFRDTDGTEQTIHASKVVSAMGPYTGQVLKSHSYVPSKAITPKRIFLAFFTFSPSKYNSFTPAEKQKIKDFLPLIDVGPSYHFAMIEKFNSGGIPLIKSGGHFQRDDIEDLDGVWQLPVNEQEQAWSRKHLTEYFKRLNLPLESEDLIYDHGYSCVYSLTESEVPLVDFLPDDQGKTDANFVMMGGMSGVGAKGAMTYGRMASNLVLGINEEEFMYKKTLRKLSFEGR